MSSTPTAWKMDGLELSPQEKLNWLYAKCTELQEEISQAGGSTVTVTADYTEQTYNNKLATITVDETATKIYAPKVEVTNLKSDGLDIGTIKIGSTSKSIKIPISPLDGTVISMPARVLLGFQTALAQINSTSVKSAQAYASDSSDQDDVDLASEMVGLLANAKNILPAFAAPSSEIIAYPLGKDTIYYNQEPEQYNLWYKLPQLTEANSTTFMFDIYVRLNILVEDGQLGVPKFYITLYGTMNTLSS